MCRRGLALRDQIAMEVRSHIGGTAGAWAAARRSPSAARRSADAGRIVPCRGAAAERGVLAARRGEVIDFSWHVPASRPCAAFLWYVLCRPRLHWLLPLLCIMMFLPAVPGYTLLAEYRAGQTIGKRLMSIHVVRESGARISLGQSVMRQLPLLRPVLLHRRPVRPVHRSQSTRLRAAHQDACGRGPVVSGFSRTPSSVRL